MALKSLAVALPQRDDPAEVTIEHLGEPLRFSRPRVGDLNPPRELLEGIGRNFPGLRPDQMFMCYLMGRGYVPDPSEGSILAHELFATIASENDLEFADITRKWEGAFPEFANWTAARFTAKNDSGTVQEGSGIESPTSPSDLESSPETSTT